MAGQKLLSTWAAGLAICAGFAVLNIPATAQDWGWGRERGYDGDRYERPAPRPQYSPPPQSSYGQPPAGNQTYGSTNPRCKELEFQLAGGSQSSGDQLPRIDAEMRQVEAQFYRAKSDAERGDCYEDMFLFGRSLKRNPRCIDLDRQVQTAQSRLASLKAQRDSAVRGNSPRNRRDDLVAELARNRCGDNYSREYEQQRNRSNSIFSFFSDEDPNDSGRNQFPASSSTFKTMCVRLCDGFYFPVSYATTENQFNIDAAKCQSQCAAPAELFVARTDQDAEQMTSHVTGRAYTQIPNAFRNRKVYIKGCSCNASEFSRDEIAKSEETLRQPPVKRADASARTAPEPQTAPRTPLPPVTAAPPSAAKPSTPSPANPPPVGATAPR